MPPAQSCSRPLRNSRTLLTARMRHITLVISVAVDNAIGRSLRTPSPGACACFMLDIQDKVARVVRRTALLQFRLHIGTAIVPNDIKPSPFITFQSCRCSWVLHQPLYRGSVTVSASSWAIELAASSAARGKNLAQIQCLAIQHKVVSRDHTAGEHAGSNGANASWRQLIPVFPGRNRMLSLRIGWDSALP